MTIDSWDDDGADPRVAAILAVDRAAARRAAGEVVIPLEGPLMEHQIPSDGSRPVSRAVCEERHRRADEILLRLTEWCDRHDRRHDRDDRDRRSQGRWVIGTAMAAAGTLISVLALAWSMIVGN